MKAKIKGTNKVVDVNKKVNPHASHVNDYIFIIRLYLYLFMML